MNTSRIFAALLLAIPALAQNVPHLAYVLPAGGQQGTTVQVTLGGQFLPNINAIHLSGAGLQATVVAHPPRMNANQATALRDRMQELQKKPMDAAVQEEMTGIRVKLLKFNADRFITPVLAETVTLRVTIAPDAAPGKRELRVASPAGLSNPLVFCVGQLPEFSEQEAIDVLPLPANQPFNIGQVQIHQPPTDMRVTLPAVINGRIKPRLGTPQQQGRAVQPFTPGEVDRYRFQARQGQELVFAASARELIPYLADAVPGWFQAVLTLYDAAGKEVAYNDDYRFHPDPVIHFTVPKDGEYVVEIKDALYRGREDFVYRITAGELPFVTGIFPLGGRAGAKTTVALTGWNLPANRTTARYQEPGIHTLGTRPFLVDNLPEILQKGSTQRIKLPIIVNGRIDRPGEWDVFRFEGRAGQAIVAEVYARRLDSPLDSVLKLTDAKGKQLAFNDDFDDASQGLETHHADSRILTTLPANGTYYLHLGDVQQKGGPEYAYRLRIGAPRPDFDLRVTPAAINTAGGITVPVTVEAVRKDGFSGAIRLALRNAPPGFLLAGAVVPAGEDRVRLTLTVPPQARQEPIALVMEGRATIDGREVTRQAVPAENMMQAFFYWHLVPTSDLTVTVRRGALLRAPIKVAGAQPLRIPAGGAVRFRVQIPVPVTYSLNDPPPGVELKSATPVADGAEIELQCDAAKAKPGTKGNLIFDISTERTPPAAAGRPPANRQRVAMGTLPAVPFEIVRP